jgi:hypothetical protein
LIVAGCNGAWRGRIGGQPWRARPGAPPGGVNGAACHLVEAQAAETRRPSHTRNLEKRCFIAPNKCPGIDARGCVTGRHDWRCLETPALPALLDARAPQAHGWVLAPAPSSQPQLQGVLSSFAASSICERLTPRRPLLHDGTSCRRADMSRAATALA